MASTGWMAGVRAKAATLIEYSGFMDRVRELLRAAPAIHADDTPARAAGRARYVHVACTAITLRSRWYEDLAPGYALEVSNVCSNVRPGGCKRRSFRGAL